jgi:competence protein ComGC
VVVKEKEGGFGLTTVLLVLAIVAVVVIVVVVMAMRSRKAKPAAVEGTASLVWPGDKAVETGAKAPEAEEPPKIEIEIREV